MSDKGMIDKAQGLIDWAKQNTMLAGIVITIIPAVGTFGYHTITKANEIIAMYEEFGDVSAKASKAVREVEYLKERSAQQQETIIKLQERLSDALLNSKEAKTMSESTQREVKSLAQSQEVQLKSLGDSVKSELNAIKRATSNRLGQ